MTDLKHRLEFVDPASLGPNPANWRRHGADQRAAFEGLLAEVGWVVPVVFNATTGRLLDGHMRREQAIACRLPAIPVVTVELDEAREAKVLASIDTLGMMAELDAKAFEALLRDVDTGSAELMGLFSDLAEEWDIIPEDDPIDEPRPSRGSPSRKPEAAPEAPDVAGPDDDQAEDDDDEVPADATPEPGPQPEEDPGVPDVVFASDNEWGIPTLDPRMQADYPDYPVTIWGSVGRKRPMPGTWCFYTADKRFGPVWKNPRHVLESGAVAIVEPNYSTHPQMPMARVLWDVFKKRWLARYWQTCGLKVFVDLNVCETPEARRVNFLGVPRGWRAYAARSHAGGSGLVADFEAAAAHSGRDDLVFLVYGGGESAKALCAERGWFWAPENSDISRGRKIADG